jgi:sporulation-control protein spo0M
MDLRKIKCEYVDYIKITQDLVQEVPFVDTVMKSWVPQKWENS